MDPLSDVAREILAMAERDQAMRRGVLDGTMSWDPSVDREHTERMRRIVDELGWPTRSRVGANAEHMAWLLVQHADADIDLQKRCLALMRDAPPGEVCPAHLAYLEDRINVHEGRPQRYGTQGRHGDDGLWRPHQLADDEHVDELRASVGLGPLDEYIASFAPRSGASRARPGATGGAERRR